jgi:hypothetical protein
MSNPARRSRQPAARNAPAVVGTLLGISGGLLGGLFAQPAAAVAQPAWSQAVSLVRCPLASGPRVVFPASDPFHASGQGAILWSGDPADCSQSDAGQAGVGIAEFEPNHTLGAPVSLPVAGDPALSSLSAVTATGNGRIVLAGSLGAAAGETGGLSQGPAGGPFSVATGLGGPSTKVAVTSSYRGNVAIASVSSGGKVELRLEQNDAPSISPPIVLTSQDATVTALTVNQDYRGDTIVAWAEKGEIFARVRASTGVVLPTQRVASSPPAPRLEALISDDNRAIIAWESDRRSAGGATTTTSAYLDISGVGVHFFGPHLLERFVDPAGLVAPSSGLQLVRLAYEGVVVAWTGLSEGHFVIRVAPVSVSSMRPTTTISDPSSDAMLSTLGTGPDDEALALWTTAPRVAGRPDPSQERILSARGVSEPSGVAKFEAPELVTGPGPLGAPALGIDPVTDVAVAVWRNVGRNPGIDYAVRGSAASETSIAGKPGTPQPARRSGRSGPSSVLLVIGGVLVLVVVMLGLWLSVRGRQRHRARPRRADDSRRAIGLRPLRRRLLRTLSLNRSDS